MTDIWTPDDQAAPLGDLAYTDYADLLDQLRRDLQLDASTDLLAGSIAVPVNLSSQTVASVTVTTLSYNNGGPSNIAVWTGLTQGTYLGATTAGIKANQAGVIVAECYVRFDSATGHRFTYPTINGVPDAAAATGGVNDTLEGSGEAITVVRQLAKGDTLSVAVYQDSGSIQTLNSAHINAVYLTP